MVFNGLSYGADTLGPVVHDIEASNSMCRLVARTAQQMANMVCGIEVCYSVMEADLMMFE